PAGLVLTTDWRLAAAKAEHLPTVLDRGRDAGVLHHRAPTAYLVRPDRHVAYAGPPDSPRLDAALAALGAGNTAEPPRKGRR
ncbi:hypothetical protein ACFQZU_11610, partial [Streptomonospora algeriensis]